MWFPVHIMYAYMPTICAYSQFDEIISEGAFCFSKRHTLFSRKTIINFNIIQIATITCLIHAWPSMDWNCVPANAVLTCSAHARS